MGQVANFFKIKFIAHFSIEKCATCLIFKKGVIVTLLKGDKQKYSQDRGVKVKRGPLSKKKKLEKKLISLPKFRSFDQNLAVKMWRERTTVYFI